MDKQPQEPREAGAAAAGRTSDRAYEKPTLVRRERLAQVSADTKTSGISSDNLQSDRRLKEDIRLVGRTFDGLNVYTFRFRDQSVVQMGVMAQEVLPLYPEAVGERDGYLTVDYGRIGAAAGPDRSLRRYHKPDLVRRERLSQVSAVPASSNLPPSDVRLKRDLRLVGRTFDGLDIYTYCLAGERVVRMGVLAQEVLPLHPEAVIERDGYLAVDYGKIGAAAGAVRPH
jgi:hypothetical protein